MTVTQLQRAALAGALAIPITAVTAVLASDDSDELIPCDGCGEACERDALTPGPLDTLWCSGCVTAAERFDYAGARFDCVEEDDGEP